MVSALVGTVALLFEALAVLRCGAVLAGDVLLGIALAVFLGFEVDGLGVFLGGVVGLVLVCVRVDALCERPDFDILPSARSLLVFLSL